MLIRVALILMLFFGFESGHAQDLKVKTVKLKAFTDPATVVLDCDSFKIYIRSSVAVKYLIKCRQKSLYFGSGTDVLVKAIKATSNNGLYIRDTLVYLKGDLPDTAATQTRYAGPMNQVFPYLLDAGAVMIYDVKQHVFVNSISISKLFDGDYFGAFARFKAYLPDGRLFYWTNVR